MSTLLADFLGRIERSEAALLSWGLVDGAMAEVELHELAEDFLDEFDHAAEFSSPYLFLEALVSRGLLFRWDEGGSYRYRSRMAESLRLLARLRQMFPRHLRQSGDWALSPTLVSDFRFVLRPREYPRRNLPPGDCLNRWVAEGIRLSPLQRSALGAMLGLATPHPNSLAGFQERATARILGEAGTGRPTGTVICAGTGSGKTMAFYVPALAHLVGSVERDSSNYVRAIALYPRNELLKDQFTEIFRQTKRLKPLLTAEGRHPICVGAYFGPTPHRGSDVEDPEKKEWSERAEGKVCPFLVCPEANCNGAMVWRNEDRARDTERLVCESCDSSIEADEIVLTRARMLRMPPDVLFTTTEMMNQRLTDSQSYHLFGIGTPLNRKPTLVLLDEAHTYRGVHGAQTAYLLRRWRHCSHAKCHYAGLSATLMEAAAFFAQLTGLSADNVEEVSPETAEMVKEGMEYMVALRGDPVSGASLLSTTIQTAMLLRRILDLNSGLPSDGTYGRKVFLFTDDLDVKNRMYFTLLDAEGQDAYGRPDPSKQGGSLANLRATTGPEDDRRFAFGQSWRLSEEIGHGLRPQNYIRLGRVSSQDEGVDSEAEVIVATASLEVGFNDPAVGAVLQHKAPRDPAAFLQRKGRAGRSRNMRPWTVIVLSDFGRDRLAYQAYDLLFDPELRPGDLPLGNRHVLKMQAVSASLDWMAHQLRSQGGHVWRDMSAPANSSTGPWVEYTRARHEAAAAILDRVLQGGDDLDSLTDWLRRSLGLRNAGEIQALLWEAPRALMTEVLPTWHRRLRTQWQRGATVGQEYYRFNHPLPEFISGTLFSELNLPEVIVMASPGPGRPEREHPMSIAAALREFAPGRISRRFGITHGLSRHWLPVDLTATGVVQAIDVNTFCDNQEREDLGLIAVTTRGQEQRVRVLRPSVLHVRADAPRDHVKDSSNAFLDWHTRFFPPDDPTTGMRLDLPVPSPWSEIVDEIRFFPHRHYQPVSVWRFATGARATINSAGGTTTELDSQFVLRNGDQSEAAAVGFCFDVDGIRIRLRVPTDWKLDGNSRFPGKVPALRVARFRWLLLNEPCFEGQLSPFERGWLAEITVSAVSAISVRDQCDPAAAWTVIRSGNSNLNLATVLDVMFQTLPTEEDDPTARVEQARLQELRQTIADASILSALDSLVPVLWNSPDAGWQPWLRERYVATFAAAFLEAVQQSCPEVDAGDLLIDLETENELFCTVWLTEDAPGGGGVIERLLPLLAEAPRRFLDLLHAALGESDYEITDTELQRILRLAANEPALAQAMEDIRAAPTLAELTARFQAFRVTLNERGVRTTHGVLAGLAARVLRPGSNDRTDQIALSLANRWNREETRLNLEIDQRSLVYALSHSDELDTALNNGALPIGPGQDRRIWRFNALGSIAWARGSHARNQGLGLWSPYANLPLPERWLLLDLLGAREPRVQFGTHDWRRQCENLLIENGRIALTSDRSDLAALRSALVGLLANPLDIGSLLVYPRLRGIERTETGLSVMLELVTAGQVSSDDEPSPASTARLIVRTAKGEREEIRDLLESLVAVELLAPGDELWLVSPWVSDLALLDNRSGGYAGLEPAWPKRYLSLAELLVFALRSNPALRVSVVTRPVEHNQRFCSRLRNLAELDGCSDRLSIDSSRAELHTKGLIATAFALNGSMNFTRSGVEVLEETVQLETEPARIGQFRLNMHFHYQ